MPAPTPPKPPFGLSAVLPAFERATRLAPRSGLVYFARSNLVHGPMSLIAQEALLRRSIQLNPTFAPTYNALGGNMLLVGRIDEAGEAARQACELARKRSERGYEAWAMRLLGEIHARQDPPDVERAEAAYVEAMARAEELGMRPLVAHCHLGLSKLYRRTGKRQEAQEHLATATTMYRDMDMPFWLEQAEEERKVSAGESLRSSTASGSTPARPL